MQYATPEEFATNVHEALLQAIERDFPERQVLTYANHVAHCNTQAHAYIQSHTHAHTHTASLFLPCLHILIHIHANHIFARTHTHIYI